jgi:hypothetical protein
MVLSLLTDSCLHGDITLMGHWDSESLLSSPLARPADMRQSRIRAILIPLMWLHLPQCISTMGRVPVVEGSASLPLQRGSIPVRWSSVWK